MKKQMTTSDIPRVAFVAGEENSIMLIDFNHLSCPPAKLRAQAKT